MLGIITDLGGTFWALMGATLAFVLAAIGSSKGVGNAGQAAAGVLTEDQKKFGAVMVMQALPSTQAIYAFVIAFLIIGKIATPVDIATKKMIALTISQGAYLFIAGLPVGIVGYISAVYQGKVSVSGINMLAKKPEGLGRAIVLALMVEMFAIIGFIVSILMIGKM
jgi:V/A-type H+-transporting ATPase subunit K